MVQSGKKGSKLQPLRQTNESSAAKETSDAQSDIIETPKTPAQLLEANNPKVTVEDVSSQSSKSTVKTTVKTKADEQVRPPIRYTTVNQSSQSRDDPGQVPPQNTIKLVNPDSNVFAICTDDNGMPYLMTLRRISYLDFEYSAGTRIDTEIARSIVEKRDQKADQDHFSDVTNDSKQNDLRRTRVGQKKTALQKPKANADQVKATFAQPKVPVRTQPASAMTGRMQDEVQAERVEFKRLMNKFFKPTQTMIII